MSYVMLRRARADPFSDIPPRKRGRTKGVFTMLGFLHRPKADRCDPDIDTIARYLCMSRRVVRLAIAALEASGRLTRDGDNFRLSPRRSR
jgi:hypothetical protein